MKSAGSLPFGECLVFFGYKGLRSLRKKIGYKEIVAYSFWKLKQSKVSHQLCVENRKMFLDGFQLNADQIFYNKITAQISVYQDALIINGG